MEECLFFTNCLHKPDKLFASLDRFAEEVPVYEPEDLPEPAAMLRLETVRQSAPEAGL